MTHLLSQQAGNLTEVDRAALGPTDGHQGHAVGREGLGLATGQTRRITSDASGCMTPEADQWQGSCDQH